MAILCLRPRCVFGVESRGGPQTDSLGYGLFRDHPEFRDGYLHLGGRPGFGLEVDWAFVDPTTFGLSIWLRKLTNMRRRASVPSPACGERVGVRGVWATAQHPAVGQEVCPSPGSSAARGYRPLPAQRGEVIGCEANSISGSRAARSHTLISATSY